MKPELTARYALHEGCVINAAIVTEEREPLITTEHPVAQRPESSAALSVDDVVRTVQLVCGRPSHAEPACQAAEDAEIELPRFDVGVRGVELARGENIADFNAARLPRG